ncbi:valyl tRNA synthetase modifier [Acinetobacter phage 133]|uniref:Vs valyl-tRNA synthetase modifier n=1 Tax=Acinetobacter phage 133 TaxID=2919552 RepID=D9I657_9CAUD|nr:valyl tRNA synthetase modifier [Acinetobacter phage 133]ADJ19438.1 Vs valyl-tRNA synthetase modifier [Acinetobacter phage 133]
MKKIALALALVLTPFMAADAKLSANEVQKEAGWFCSTNRECIDVISLELESMYFQGLNERDPVTIGTLVNRKHRELSGYCEYAPEKKMCEAYKSKLMLQYITGLLDR